MSKESWCVPAGTLESGEWARRGLVLVALLAMLLGTAPAVLAAGADQSHQWPAKPKVVSPDVAGPHRVAYSASFRLMASVTAGVCPDVYANQCASGSCICLYLVGHGAGNRIGRVPEGQVFGELTLDVGDVPGDPDGNCFPSFGAIQIVGSKDAELLDFTGAMCEAFGTAELQIFNGGWEFDTQSFTTFDGLGQARGKFLRNGDFNLSFHGSALTGGGMP
jgi:hypothetical protein